MSAVPDALAAGTVAPALLGGASHRIGRRRSAAVFIGLGIFTALTGSRGAQWVRPVIRRSTKSTPAE